MLKIAFCDDDQYYIDYMSQMLREILEDMRLEYDIVTFNDGKSLLKDYRKEESYDLMFIDIGMNEMDGITLVKRIREMDEQVILVFLTMLEDRVFETFGYNIFRFITKKSDDAHKKYIFRECIERAKSLKNIYIFNTDEGKLKIKESEIVYFERNLRKFYMMTIRGKYRVIVDNFEQLNKVIESSPSFQMLSRSTLINLRFVDEITKNNEVIARYGNEKEVFAISRGKKRAFYDQFINYLR